MSDKKSKFFALLTQRNKKSTTSPLQRSASVRNIPSPQLDSSNDSQNDSSIQRLEELEISLVEKNDIIQRLSQELAKVRNLLKFHFF
jgi:molecular chaperone GrpE (heat shock protein)